MNNLVTNFRVLTSKEYYTELEHKSCYLIGMDGYLINYDNDLISECNYKTDKVINLEEKIKIKERMVVTNAKLYDKYYTDNTSPSEYDNSVAGDLHYDLWFALQEIEQLKADLKVLLFDLQMVSNKVKTRMELMADAVLPEVVDNSRVTEDIILEIRNCYVLGYSIEETQAKLNSFGIFLTIQMIKNYLDCYKDCRIVI